MTAAPDVRAPTDQEREHHDRRDAHRSDSSLGDIILGGQDGLVNVLGVILGVAAATSDTRLVLVAGLAATLAESVSMAAVAFTSKMAGAELYEAERAREHRHIRDVPAIERDELRAIFARKGFSGDMLERIVDTITRDPEVWVAVMMAEEHRLAPIERKDALRSAAVVGAASLLGSLVPLAPFALLPVKTGMIASVVVAGATLFAAGWWKRKLTVGRPLHGGLELAAIGIVSALVGYAVGALLQVPVTP